MAQLDKIFSGKDYLIGFWHIEESSAELLDMIKDFLDEDELSQYSQFTHERRRCEWLASRNLIYRLTGKYHKVFYEVSGKPYIEGGKNISITHSYDIAGVMISPLENIGLDVEKMNLRILKIEHKFMEKSEIQGLKPDSKLQSLYVNWCAKEAMYKAFNIKDFDFKDNFRLEAFQYQKEGVVPGKIMQGGFQKNFTIRYYEFDGYMTAWCAE
ncbi:MAG: 4'-phosphopantetheinyl transferase superfamily protein [Bacteroidales bacterium]|nr:4'-phosphopantetheinyl transferase superfamily protein [Bacteroidales bacterium]